MTMTYSNTRVQSITKTVTRNLLAVLALGMLFTACKKDDDDKPDNPNNGGGSEQGYFPTKTNTLWKYRSDDDGDISEHNLRVVNQKDSAGGKVVHYQVAYDDGSKLNPFVLSTSNQVIYANPLPSDLTEVMDGIQQDPDVSEFEMSGFPVLQKLPANPKAGDVVQFSDPMHIGWIQSEEGEEYPISMDFAFSDGKIIGFEDVTTPAGTYKNCLKWEYKATLSMQVGSNNPQNTVLQNTLWYAKGVGLVKSTENSNGSSSTTTLIAVQ